ncbi:hypothetical protein E2C01_046450 [Portunus trituberculatus]|uniref:Uncharacterized protein n=1 Tax=Portunus trituberculatus TaxID=210409 RepID=A0A5B7G4T1_PORTR|nr:hypothetical protein [Portunus trituberculatus]
MRKEERNVGVLHVSRAWPPVASKAESHRQGAAPLPPDGHCCCRVPEGGAPLRWLCIAPAPTHLELPPDKLIMIPPTPACAPPCSPGSTAARPSPWVTLLPPPRLHTHAPPPH